ncbi:MAG: cupin domain-containing protein [Pseudodesulfovibrio sp.]
MTHAADAAGAGLGFTVPPGHVGFAALRLAGRIDARIADCAIARIEPGGGGPMPEHTHAHDHLFVVLAGSVEIRMDGTTTTLPVHQSMLVPGDALHSVWNTAQIPATVLGISLDRAENG